MSCGFPAFRYILVAPLILEMHIIRETLPFVCFSILFAYIEMNLENTRGVVASLLERLSLPETLLYGGSMWMIYRLMSALYNISPLHPLNHIPGPKLAAATYFPEFWHDVIRGGRYTRRIREMHEEYG